MNEWVRVPMAATSESGSKYSPVSFSRACSGHMRSVPMSDWWRYRVLCPWSSVRSFMWGLSVWVCGHHRKTYDNVIDEQPSEPSGDRRCIASGIWWEQHHDMGVLLLSSYSF